MRIFISGCCGYIGSHVCVELLNYGYDIIGLDNFSNSDPDVLDSIYQITGKRFSFYEGDLCDQELLERVFYENDIDVVIDLAAYKSVGDSVSNPINYYINNVSSVLNLIQVMQKYQVKSMIFSSTATVYGVPSEVPIPETARIGNTTNPYSTSKYFVERILADLCISDSEFKVCVFRYFNPIGAHSSGLIGDNPNDIPANLMPFIAKVATGELEHLEIFGADYNTEDGTGVRDYIHVVDLAKAHLCGIKKLEEMNYGIVTYNLGTGVGYSVFDIVHTFENVNSVNIPYQIVDRRPGDIDLYYGDPSLAHNELCWKAELDIEDMCRDTYQYVKKRGKI